MLGEGSISTAGAGDMAMVNNVAREMVYRCGFSKRLGPVALMDTEEVFIGRGRTRAIANVGTELAAIALSDIEEVRASANLRFAPMPSLVLVLRFNWSLYASLLQKGSCSSGR